MQALIDLDQMCEEVERLIGPTRINPGPVGLMGSVVLRYGSNDEIIGTIFDSNGSLTYKHILHVKIAKLDEFSEVSDYLLRLTNLNQWASALNSNDLFEFAGKSYQEINSNLYATLEKVDELEIGNLETAENFVIHREEDGFYIVDTWHYIFKYKYSPYDYDAAIRDQFMLMSKSKYSPLWTAKQIIYVQRLVFAVLQVNDVADSVMDYL